MNREVLLDGHFHFAELSRWRFWACSRALLVACLLLFAAPALSAEEASNATKPVEANLTQTDESTTTTPPPQADNQTKRNGIQAGLNTFFKVVNNTVAGVLFWQPLGKNVPMPLVVIVLAFGAVFFTLRFGFVNIRLFGHSLKVICGKYDDPEDLGEITHFQALTTALSATVGLGNIAGVAVAISLGGPGAVFWMWLLAFCGMSMKFSCCTLAQIYRRIAPDGTILGGPMVYLEEGIKQEFPALKQVGKIFATGFAVILVLAAIGGGNLFQGKTTYEIAKRVIPSIGNIPHSDWLAGGIFAVLVGLVIIGGVRRVAVVTCRLVPAMCIFYCLVCLTIIFWNIDKVPALLLSIVQQAFTPDAAFKGGMMGVLVIGFQRAAFSNEAGLGSAAMAHAAAKTDEPVREGTVAMIGPFIDTIVVCTMTALTILITGVNKNPGAEISDLQGTVMTADAFGTLHATFKYLLVPAVCIFAYSTMISWSYYGDRAMQYLAGEKGVRIYRVVYVLLVVIGPILSMDNVVKFSLYMLLALAFPNILGMILLSGRLSEKLKDYTTRLKAGKMKIYK